jgi:hypothetical protein
MVYRVAKYQPWYHQPRPRCNTTTLAQTQCIFSATHSGHPKGQPQVFLCTIHAQMADFPVKLLTASNVLVRED